MNGLRYLISRVDNLTPHQIRFDSRIVPALAEIHENRVTEDSVEACLRLLETRIYTFVRGENERLVYEGGDFDERRMRFAIDHALYVECFYDN